MPGGAKWPLSKENADYLLCYLPEALTIAVKTLAMFKKCLAEFEDVARNFGNFPSYYLGLVTPKGGLEHYDGKIRIVDPEGRIVADQLDPAGYQEYIGEAVEPWSYMKFPYYKPLGYPEGDYRVGPLARGLVNKYPQLMDLVLKIQHKLTQN
jgi:NAD-reducing hydrogenase large subunit